MYDILFQPEWNRNDYKSSIFGDDARNCAESVCTHRTGDREWKKVQAQAKALARKSPKEEKEGLGGTYLKSRQSRIRVRALSA